MNLKVFVISAAIGSVLVPRLAAAQEPVSCGPQGLKHTVVKHKGEHPVPSPAEGRAMLVIVAGGSFFKSYQTKLAVNGEWRAVMNENQYSYFEVDPDEGQKLLRKKTYVTFEVRDEA